MTIEEGENEGEESRSCAVHDHYSGKHATKSSSIKPGAMLAAASLEYMASAASNAINTAVQHTLVSQNNNAMVPEATAAVTADSQILTGAFDMTLGRRPAGSLVDAFKSSLHSTAAHSICRF